jgi:hypothetical protein
VTKIESKMEWVDEVPPRGGGGGMKGTGKYAAIVGELQRNAGNVMKLGPYTPGAASGAVSRLKELGVNATSRTIDGDTYVYTWAESEWEDALEGTQNDLDEGGPFEEVD